MPPGFPSAFVKAPQPSNDGDLEEIVPDVEAMERHIFDNTHSMLHCMHKAEGGRALERQRNFSRNPDDSKSDVVHTFADENVYMNEGALERDGLLHNEWLDTDLANSRLFHSGHDSTNPLSKIDTKPHWRSFMNGLSSVEDQSGDGVKLSRSNEFQSRCSEQTRGDGLDACYDESGITSRKNKNFLQTRLPSRRDALTSGPISSELPALASSPLFRPDAFSEPRQAPRFSQHSVDSNVATTVGPWKQRSNHLLPSWQNTAAEQLTSSAAQSSAEDVVLPVAPRDFETLLEESLKNDPNAVHTVESRETSFSSPVDSATNSNSKPGAKRPFLKKGARNPVTSLPKSAPKYRYYATAVAAASGAPCPLLSKQPAVERSPSKKPLPKPTLDAKSSLRLSTRRVQQMEASSTIGQSKAPSQTLRYSELQEKNFRDDTVKQKEKQKSLVRPSSFDFQLPSKALKAQQHATNLEAGALKTVAQRTERTFAARGGKNPSTRTVDDVTTAAPFKFGKKAEEQPTTSSSNNLGPLLESSLLFQSKIEGADERNVTQPETKSLRGSQDVRVPPPLQRRLPSTGQKCFGDSKNLRKPFTSSVDILDAMGAGDSSTDQQATMPPSLPPFAETNKRTTQGDKSKQQQPLHTGVLTTLNIKDPMSALRGGPAGSYSEIKRRELESQTQQQQSSTSRRPLTENNITHTLDSRKPSNIVGAGDSYLEMLAAQAQAKIATVDEQIARLRDLQDELDQKSLQLERERAEWEADRDQQRLRFAAERESFLMEIEQAKEALRKRETRLEVGLEDVDELASERDKLESENRKLRLQLVQLQEEFSGKEERYRRLVDRLGNQVYALEKKNKVLTETLDELEQTSQQLSMRLAEQHKLADRSSRMLQMRRQNSTGVRSRRSTITGMSQSNPLTGKPSPRRVTENTALVTRGTKKPQQASGRSAKLEGLSSRRLKTLRSTVKQNPSAGFPNGSTTCGEARGTRGDEIGSFTFASSDEEGTCSFRRLTRGSASLSSSSDESYFVSKAQTASDCASRTSRPRATTGVSEFGAGTPSVPEEEDAEEMERRCRNVSAANNRKQCYSHPPSASLTPAAVTTTASSSSSSGPLDGLNKQHTVVPEPQRRSASSLNNSGRHRHRRLSETMASETTSGVNSTTALSIIEKNKLPQSEFSDLLDFVLELAWRPFDDALKTLSLPDALQLIGTAASKPDGRQELRYKDGHREVVFTNGMRKIICPNGWIFSFFTNGDIRGVDPYGFIYYYYHNDTIYNITTPEGRAYNSFPDGQVDCRFPDGKLQVRFPQGLLKQIDPDGVEHLQRIEMSRCTLTTHRPVSDFSKRIIQPPPAPPTFGVRLPMKSVCAAC